MSTKIWRFYKMKQNEKRAYKPQEFANMVGVTVKTLQNWDNSGKLIAHRSPTNRRYYTYYQYKQCMSDMDVSTDIRRRVIYARVSTKNQKDDLKNQVEFLKTFCNARGLIVDECIEDFGSGMNYNREKWNSLLDSVLNDEISEIVISCKDRFVRFGFDWFERLCNSHNTKIIVVNNEALSPQQELVEDIISILHEFSCRLYGLRKYKKQIQEDNNLNEKL